MDGFSEIFEKLVDEVNDIDNSHRNSQLQHNFLPHLTGEEIVEFLKDKEHLILDNLNTTKQLINEQIENIEKIDLIQDVITFKTYSVQHEFRTQIEKLKEQIEVIKSEEADNLSELSLKLTDMETSIEKLQADCLNQIQELNDRKLYYQEHSEKDAHVLEMNFSTLKKDYKNFVHIISEKWKTNPELQEKTTIKIIEDYKDFIEKCEELQESNWVLTTLETKVSNQLDVAGLKITKDGLFLTASGKMLTFEEAKNDHYFDNMSVSWETIFKQQITHKISARKGHESFEKPGDISEPSDTSTAATSESTLFSLPTEDINYLKDKLGKPLTMAMAEVIAVQPRDPIHYLGHWLFKYRFNQEMDQVQQIEIDALTAERNRIAKEKWQHFLQAEARNVVLDMIFNAEEDALRRELRRVEMDMLKMQEEGG